jgi:betaine-aldehyde dehydrogenase
VSEGAEDDALAAVAAARAAFDDGDWPRTPAPTRAALLHRVADLLEANKGEVARAESLDTGKRLVEGEYDVDDVVSVFRHFAGVAGDNAGRVVDPGRADVVSRIVREPVGVCSLITPWNYPLLQTAWKVAPALAAGNTFVLKPSELTPSTAICCSVTWTRPGSRRGLPTSCWAQEPRSVLRSPRHRRSTSSPSPAACTPAGR